MNKFLMMHGNEKMHDAFFDESVASGAVDGEVSGGSVGGNKS